MDTYVGKSNAAAAYVSSWSGSNIENLARAALIVTMFVGSIVLAAVLENGYLWLMEKTGAYKKKGIEEVVSTYEMFRKVQHGAKIFLNKSSFRGDEHAIEALRTGHFFTDRHEKLKKDAQQAKGGICGNKCRGDEIIICPPDVSVYPVEVATSSHKLQNILFESRNSEQQSQFSSSLSSSKFVTNTRDDPSVVIDTTDTDGGYSNSKIPLYKNHNGATKRTSSLPLNTRTSIENGRSESLDDENTDSDDFSDSFDYNEEKMRTKSKRFHRSLADVTEEWKEEEYKLAYRLKQELRPLRLFLRGNFHPLFANTIFVFVSIAGWLFAFFLLGVDFFSMIGGATFLMAVTLFKLADFLKNWIAYYSILWSDLIQKGDMITLPTTYGSPGEKIGCVLDITTSSVKILTSQPHNSLGIQDVRWEWIMTTGKYPTNSIPKPGVSYGGRYVKTESNIQNPQNRSNLKYDTIEVESNDDHDILYVERHLRVIYDVVVVPNYLFTEWTVARPTFWRRTLQCRPCPQKSVAKNFTSL